MKKIQQILVISCTSLSLISLSQAVKAQTKQSCFMTETSGKVVDLSALCDTRKIERSPSGSSASPTNEDRQELKNVYFIGDGEVPFTLGSSSSTYYVGETTGRSSAYIRRYSNQATFTPREGIKSSLSSFFQQIKDPNSTLLIRNGQAQTPFLIYRYPKSF